jgi:predicted metal-dependent hydrolase
VEKVEIKGKSYPVEMILSRNRTAIARLKDHTIVISIPSKWSRKDKEETFQNLLKRSVRSIEKGRWTVEGSRKITFSHGQKLKAMGKRFEVHYSPGERFRGRVYGEKIEISVPEHPEKHEKASEHVKRQIVNALMPDIRARIEHHNAFFNAEIKRINIRDNLTLWGSCSTDGTISLNFRLLFMPESVLDYVIVHELAHTRYKSHGKRFWGLVDKAMPDYQEHRKWLRENGWSIFSKKAGQLTLMDF